MWEQSKCTETNLTESCFVRLVAFISLRPIGQLLLRHFGLWDMPVICLTVVSKFAVMVFISLYFQTFWPNWLNFFCHFKNICGRKKTAPLCCGRIVGQAKHKLFSFSIRFVFLRLVCWFALQIQWRSFHNRPWNSISDKLCFYRAGEKQRHVLPLFNAPSRFSTPSSCKPCAVLWNHRIFKMAGDPSQAVSVLIDLIVCFPRFHKLCS